MKITVKDRRRVKSVANPKNTQLRIALALLALMLLPSLILSMAFTSRLPMEARRLGDEPGAGTDLTQNLLEAAFRANCIVLTLFLASCIAAFFFAVMLWDRLVGPIPLLEEHIDDMIEGNFESRRELRDKDFLKPLGQKLNLLAETLSKQTRSGP